LIASIFVPAIHQESSLTPSPVRPRLGNVFGSNSFNVAPLAVLDVVKPGPLLISIAPLDLGAMGLVYDFG